MSGAAWSRVHRARGSRRKGSLIGVGRPRSMWTRLEGQDGAVGLLSSVGGCVCSFWAIGNGGVRRGEVIRLFLQGRRARSRWNDGHFSKDGADVILGANNRLALRRLP